MFKCCWLDERKAIQSIKYCWRDLSLLAIYTPWVRKTGHSTFTHSFDKYWPISNFFNQQTRQWLRNGIVIIRSNCTLNSSLHYLVESLSSKIALISTLFYTSCGLSIVSSWIGLLASQTSEAIWLYTLRYHNTGVDRFFWLWPLLHAVFA